MRKIIASILALLCLLSLAACGAQTGRESFTSGSDVFTSGSDIFTSGSDVYATGSDISDYAFYTPDKKDIKVLRSVHVETVDELLDSIAPNTAIYLDAEEFNLSDASDYGGRGSAYYYWQECGDGYGLAFRELDDFALIGGGKDKTTLLSEPRYAEVLYFSDCRRISLHGLTAGHTEAPEGCSAAALGLINCKGVYLDGCGLFGCGVEGIEAIGITSLYVKDTEIYDCSYVGAYLNLCGGVQFVDCDMHDCGTDDFGYNGMQMYGCNAVVYNGLAAPNSDKVDCYIDGENVMMEAENIWTTDGDIYGEAYTSASNILTREDYTVPEIADRANVAHVNTVDELLAAIAPDTVIYLEAEEFDLSTASGYGKKGGEYYGWEECSDGYALVISDMDDLALIGMGKDKTKLLAEPRCAEVIRFDGCWGVCIEGLTAGHTEAPEGCCAAVLSFYNCGDVYVEDCGLFGCGMMGISADGCSRMLIADTDIYDCSYIGASLYDTEHVMFTGCSVRDCGSTDFGFNGLEITDCADIMYNGARIEAEGRGDADYVIEVLPVIEAAEDPAAKLPVTKSKLADFGDLKSEKDVYDYASSVFPTEKSELLIPYAAAIRIVDGYEPGERYDMYVGFFTRDGRIVTRPVFNDVRKLDIIRGSENGGEDVWSENAGYCYEIDAQYSISGKYLLLSSDGTTFRAESESDGLYNITDIRKGIGSDTMLDVKNAVTDDGSYYIADCGGCYAVCRKDGGEIVALTDIPTLSLGCRIENEEVVYFTFHDGYACTWDGDFNLLIKVRQLELPAEGPVFECSPLP